MAKIVSKNFIYLDKEDKREVKKYLLDTNHSLKWLAQKLGISYSYLHLLLGGYRPIPKELSRKLEDIGIDIRIRIITDSILEGGK